MKINKCLRSLEFMLKIEFCLERDAALPRDWAKYKDRYKGNNPKEVREWKINFRCTLQMSRRIVKLTHITGYLSSKIYQILPWNFLKVLTSKTIPPFPPHRSTGINPTCRQSHRQGISIVPTKRRELTCNETIWSLEVHTETVTCMYGC